MPNHPSLYRPFVFLALFFGIVFGAQADSPSVVSFDVSTSTVAETAGSVTITVSRVGPALDGETVNYATASGTATSGTDFLARSGTLTFAAGEGQKTIIVPIVNDSVAEVDETFTVTLSAPSGTTLGAPSVHTVTIQSEDAPVSSFQFAQAASTVAETAGQVDLVVTRTGDAITAQQVTYATANGTATAGSDYTSASGTISFAIGETQKTVSIPILDDANVEFDETFTVTLTSPTGNATVGAPGTQTVTIQSDETFPHGIIAFGVATSTATELDGSCAITVVRSGGTNFQETVQYATANGIAMAGSDYTSTSGTLTFAAGETQKTISVPIINDTAPEGDETFTVSLSNPGGGANLGALTTHTVTLFSDEFTSTGLIGFATTSSNVGENAGTVAITVVRNGATPAGETVEYTTANSFAEAGSDYTGISGTLTFAAGETQKTISVPILDDAVSEFSETFSVTLSAPGGGAALDTKVTHTVTIFDNDPLPPRTVQFATATSSIAESGGFIAVPLSSFTGDSNGFGTVHYQTSFGTAGAADFTATSGTLHFNAPGVPSDFYVYVWITPDAIPEGDETFTITLSAPTGTLVLGPQVTHTVTILDDDADHGTIAFAVTASDVAEANGTARITVVRRNAMPAGETVQYTTTANTATADLDYTTSNGTLTFAAGETEKTISVPILDDTLIENPESFTVTLSAPGGGALLGASATHTVTILDDDPHSFIGFAASSMTVSESAGTALIDVFRTGDTPAGETVQYTTISGNSSIPGNATAGSDYTLTKGTLTFAAGETQKTIKVPILSDALLEGNEIFTVVLSSPQVHALLGKSTLTVTIADTGTPTISFSQFNTISSLEGTNVDVTVLRLGDPSMEVSVHYATADGTASAGSDYTTTIGTLTFAAGETQKTITVPISDDAVAENSETFTVTLSAPGGGAQLGAATTRTVTIVDNDPPHNTIAFAEASTTTSESAAGAVNFPLTVLRSGDLVGSISVNYAAVAGTASEGTDYYLPSGTLTFAAGETQKTIAVQILNNNVAEGTETFSVVLSSPSGGAVLGPQSTHTITIFDDDAGAHGTIAFATTASNVGEGNGTASITVVRNGPTPAGETVQYITGPGTALGGSDYTTIGGTLTFAAGETQKTISVPLLDDALVENSETFTITLSAPGGGAALGVLTTHTVTILDNDAAHGTIAFATNTSSVNETAGAASIASITVIRAGATPAGETVQYATGGGDATPGSDYTATSGTLTFDAGETQKTISISIADDALFESDETFGITLSAPGGGAILGQQTTHTVTISDDEQAPTISFATASSSVSESAGAVEVTVVRNGAGAVQTVQYHTVAGSATPGTDFTAASGLLTFGANETQKTITVSIAPDNVADGGETFSIVLSAPGGGAVLGAQTTHQVTITEAAGNVIGFLADEFRVSETALHATIRVRRSGSQAGQQSVNYMITDGTATAGTDYLGATSGTLTWNAGQVQDVLLDIPIKRNGVMEGPETFYIALSNPTGGAVLGGHSLLEVVINDRPSPPTSYYGLAVSRVTGQQAHVIVTTSKLGAFSAVARFGGRTVRFTGTLAFGNWHMTQKVRPNVSCDLDVTINGAADRITGYVTSLDDGAPCDFILERAATGTAAHPAPGTGYYTAVGGTDAPPTTRGSFTFRVNPIGAVVVTGLLPDGRPFVQSTRIPDSGNLSVYGVPYAKQPGYVAGSVHLANQTFSGTLQWDTHGAAASFQADPAPLLMLVGAPYHRRTGRLLDDFDTSNGAGTITLTGPSLANPIVSPFTLRTDNKATILPGSPGRVLLSFNATTGLFNGSFLHADGQRRVFHGACVQQADALTDVVQGAFVDSSGGGAVEVTANGP